MPERRARRFAFWVAYSTAILSLVTASDFALHARYVRKLETIDKPASAKLTVVPNGSEALAREVGLNWFRVDHLSSFTRFPVAKPPGVIRIGAFGDSFTVGDEVGATSDFPTQLAALLRERGLHHVEVLNFGVSGSGFDETFLMWGELAVTYGIDYVLLGPATFFPERTTRFNPYRDFPYHLHSRFVIDGDGLARIDLLGDSYPDRFRRYYSFLTPWRYLRYDRNDPPFLAAAVPEGKIVGNPFYYSDLPEQEEAAVIHRRLLTLMRRQGKPIILGLHPEFDELRRSVADLADENLCLVDIDRPLNFPYLAPRGHNSATANRRVAQSYLAVLLGEPIEAPVLRSGEPEAPVGADVLPSPLLATYDQLRIIFDDTDVGKLADNDGRITEPSLLGRRGIGALLALKPAGRTLLDAVFLALPNGLDPSLPMHLVHIASGRSRSVAIPSRAPFAGLPSLRSADLPLIQRWWRDPPKISAEDLSTAFGGAVGIGTLRVTLGNRILLDGEIRGDSSDATLRPAVGEFLFLRAVPAGDAPEVRDSRAETSEIVLGRAGRSYALPAARWFIDPRHLTPACPQPWAAPLKDLLPAAAR